MIKQTPARISHLNFMESLVHRSSITQMVRRKPFKYGRQILPIKEINKVVKQLDLDNNAKKIKFTNLFRSIFYALVVKRNSYSRTIASSSKSMIAQKFSQLGQVSHVAVLDRLNQYDEEKMDALMVHILSKLENGVRRTSQDTDRIRIIDGTSFALSYSRVKDEFLPMGPAKKAEPVTKQRKINKGLMKLGLVVQAGNFIPIDWRFCDEYDDNQILRDLVDWSEPGYTYLIDRGNVAVDYLKKFTDNKIFLSKRHGIRIRSQSWMKNSFHVLAVSRNDLISDMRSLDGSHVQMEQSSKFGGL